MNTFKPNFVIPKRYDRLFILWNGSFRYFINADKNGITQIQWGECQPHDNGMVLDWIHETIERIRFECGPCKK